MWQFYMFSWTGSQDTQVSGTNFCRWYEGVSRTSMKIGGLSKAHCPPQHGGASSNPPKAPIERKGGGRLNSLCPPADLGYQSFLALTFPGPQISWPSLGSTPSAVWLSGPHSSSTRSPACRWHAVGLLSLSNSNSKYLKMIFFLSY